MKPDLAIHTKKVPCRFRLSNHLNMEILNLFEAQPSDKHLQNFSCNRMSNHASNAIFPQRSITKCKLRQPSRRSVKLEWSKLLEYESLNTLYNFMMSIIPFIIRSFIFYEENFDVFVFRQRKLFFCWNNKYQCFNIFSLLLISVSFH